MKYKKDIETIDEAIEDEYGNELSFEDSEDETEETGQDEEDMD